MRSPWKVNNANTGVNYQVLQTNASTTPWPALNQRRNPSLSNNNNNRQPMWVQNGSNWVKNSPSPTQFVPTSGVTPKSTAVTPPTIPRKPEVITINKAPVLHQNIPMKPKVTEHRNPPITVVTSPKTPAHNNRNHQNVNMNFLNNERSHRQ